MKKKIIKKIMLITICSVLFLNSELPAKAAQGEETMLIYAVNGEGEAIITGSSGTEKELIIPGVMDDYPVVGIAEGAFQDRVEIEKVVIQPGVRYISEYAFAGCTGLKEVKLSEGVQYLAGNAFLDASNLGDIVLPESIVYVGENAFGNCTSLSEIEYPQEAHIDGYAFEGSLWQEERDKGKFRIRGSLLLEGRGNEGPVVEIPYGITEIDDYGGLPGPTMLERSGVKYEQAILPDTLVKLGTGSFRDVWVVKVNIPDGIKSISRYAFSISEIQEIDLPEGIKTIEDSAFYDSDLKAIDIPDSVEVIEDGAFMECASLSEITIPGSVRSVGRLTFSQCDSLEKVVFEEGVVEVGADAFDYCDGLERLQFPESLETLTGQMYCPALKGVYIPEGTVNISDDIFKAYIRFEISITVYGQKGSRAEEVAEAAGMKFVEVENGDEMP